MIVKGIACLLSDSSRAKAYIQKLVRSDLLPQSTVVVELEKTRTGRADAPWGDSDIARAIRRAFENRKYFLYSDTPASLRPWGDASPQNYRTFDPDKPVADTLAESAIPYETVRAGSINDRAVADAVRRTGADCVIFSGGGLLRKEMLSLPQRFLHVHPGLVPHVRGSMAVEWGVLLHGRCAASAFLMAEEIDAGEIIATRLFDAPAIERGHISPLYSAHIRSELLVDVIRSYSRDGCFSTIAQDPAEGATFYKMHPVLNDVVFWRCRRNVDPTR